jgi:hypothetical protein
MMSLWDFPLECTGEDGMLFDQEGKHPLFL